MEQISLILFNKTGLTLNDEQSREYCGRKGKEVKSHLVVCPSCIATLCQYEMHPIVNQTSECGETWHLATVLVQFMIFSCFLLPATRCPCSPALSVHLTHTHTPVWDQPITSSPLQPTTMTTTTSPFLFWRALDYTCFWAHAWILNLSFGFCLPVYGHLARFWTCALSPCLPLFTCL